MLRLAVATLRARWLSLAGSVVALVAGVALVTAAGATINAAAAGPGGRTLRYSAADVVVRAEPHRQTPDGYAFTLAEPPPLPLSTVDTIARLPGVAAVTLDRIVPVDLRSTDAGRPWRGHGWASAALTPYRLVAGRPPQADDEVAVDETVRDADVATGGRRYRVVGLVRAAAQPTGERPVFFTDREAARASGTPDRVAAIAVRARPGTDVNALARSIEAAVKARAYAGDDRRRADVDPYADALDHLSLLLGMLAAIAAFVAVFVVASTFAYAVGQRRRELALLRALGMTRRQVARLVRTEALLVGAAAATTGAAGGIVAAAVLARVLVAAGVAPDGFTVPLRPGVFGVPAAVGIALGLAVAVLGSAAAVRRAGAVSPLDALRQVLVEQRVMSRARWIGGSVALAAGGGLLALLPVAPADGRLALALIVCLPLVTAAALLAPAFAGRVGALVTTPAAAATVPARLARANLRVAVRRTASVAAPILVTVGLGTSLLGVTGVLVAAGAADARSRYAAPVVVLPDGASGLSPEVLHRIASAPGVAATVPVVETSLHAVAHRALREQQALAVDGTQVARVLRLGRVDGDLTALTGDTVAVSRTAAAALGWRLGALVDTYLADGEPATLRVVAEFDGTGILLPTDLAAAHDPHPAPDLALLSLTEGADPRAVIAALSGDAVALPTAVWLDRTAAAQRAGMRLGAEILAGVALAYTLLAVVNTVAMAAGTRVGEYGRLRLAGAWRRQVLAMAGWEATGVTAVGVALGAAVTAVTVVGAWLAMRRPGVPVPLALPWPELGALALLCLVLTVATMVTTTWLGLRTRPIEAAAVRD